MQETQDGFWDILRDYGAIIVTLVAVGVLALVQKIRPHFASRSEFDRLREAAVNRVEFDALKQDVEEVRVAQSRAIDAMESLDRTLVRVVQQVEHEADSHRQTGRDVREVKEIVETIRRDQAATISRLSTILEHQQAEVGKLRERSHDMSNDITDLRLRRDLGLDDDRERRKR